MRRFSRPLAAGALGLTLLFGAACSDSGGPTTATDETQPPSQAQPTQAPADNGNSGTVKDRPAGELSTADLVKLAEPSIVRIQTNGGVGTGFVVDSDGYIMTNNHVIRGATTLRATNVGNGRTYTATVLGYSVSDDVALLQLRNASGLAAVKIGGTVRVGTAVTAYGNGHGVGGVPAPETGTVRAVGRSISFECLSTMRNEMRFEPTALSDVPGTAATSSPGAR